MWVPGWATRGADHDDLIDVGRDAAGAITGTAGVTGTVSPRRRVLLSVSFLRFCVSAVTYFAIHSLSVLPIPARTRSAVERSAAACPFGAVLAASSSAFAARSLHATWLCWMA